MDIDRDLINSAWEIRETIKKLGRTLDMIIIPTSFVRTVMRSEDSYVSNNQWKREHRYPEESKARWIFPIAYSAAGACELVRCGFYLYGIYESASKLL